MKTYLFIFYIFLLALLFGVSSSASAQTSQSIETYPEIMKKLVKENPDVDYINIGKNFRQTFKSFEYIPVDNFPENGVTYSPQALTYANIGKAIEKNSDAFLKDWNKYTDDIGWNIGTCDPIYNPIKSYQDMIGGNMYAESQGIGIKLMHSDYIKLLSCYVKNNHKISQQINTGFESYRKHNIGTGLKNFNNRVWKQGESLSMYNNIFNGTSKYVNGKALRLNKNNKVEDFSVYGGGTCGISTIFYQNGLKTFGIEVEQRKAHSNYYYSYYGKTVGLDATIFGSPNGGAAIDLVMKNNSGRNIYIKTYDYTTKGKYHYGVEFYAPFIGQNTIKEKTEKIPWKGNCYKNTITQPDGKQKFVTSCYKGVY